MTMAGSSTGRRAAAMPFIMFTVLIDMVAIGLIVPVLPLLVGTFTASPAQQTFWFGVVSFAFGIANFFGSLKWGTPVDRNPWGATTLEWLAPSPPGHGNFATMPPRAHRGPYEYSVPGATRDFTPQFEPDPQ